MWVQRVCKWEVNQALKAAGPGDAQTPADRQPRGQGRRPTGTSDHGVTGLGCWETVKERIRLQASERPKKGECSRSSHKSP